MEACACFHGSACRSRLPRCTHAARSDEQIKAFKLMNLPLACMLNDTPIIAKPTQDGPGMRIPERLPLAIGRVAMVVMTKASIQY